MATTAPLVGAGTTFTFSGFTANVNSIRWSGISRAAIKTTSLTTVGGTQTSKGNTYIASPIYDGGEVTFDIQFPATTGTPAALITAAAGTLTVTFPASSGANSLAGSAIVTSYELTSSIEDIMTATVTFKISGDLTWA